MEFQLYGNCQIIRILLLDSAYLAQIDLMMKARRKLTPGMPGTKRWQKRYGDALVCVRYRYDSERRQRVTTVELIVDKNHWEENSQKIPHNKIVFVKIKYEETYLRKVIKSAGGRWNREKKLWELPYSEAKQLGFIERIVT